MRSPPFVVSVKGIVAGVQEETFSKESNPLRLFKLHDNTGKSVACVAFGLQTDSTALASGNEVFFVCAVSCWFNILRTG